MSNTDLLPAGRFAARLSARVLALVLAVLLALPAGAGFAQQSPYPDPSYGAPSEGSAASPGFGGAPVRVQRSAGGRYEWIVIGPIDEAEAVRAAILGARGMIVRRRVLPGLGEVSIIATFPSEADRLNAQEEIARTAPNSSLAAHHIFHFAQTRSLFRAPRLYAPALIGEESPGRCRVGGRVAIGMIDGPVNPNHPALAGADVTYETLVTSGRIPAANHGTAVAALMVGEDESGALAGFARGARLHAVSVFSNTDEGEETDVERIAQGIDRLVGRGVRLINLSIAGPENASLGRAIHAAAARGVVMVAASGNDQRPQVAWPAAAPEVIAVTAIDAARHRFRLANTGSALEFSAPGVDVYAAQGRRGGGYVTGTSFAAPIVTALAARLMAQGAGSADAVRAGLRARVEPLGAGPRNADFGWGLVRAPGC